MPVKKLLLIAALLLATLYVEAQQKVIDSLRRALVRVKNDTDKIRTLNELGRLVLSSKPDTAFILLSKAMEMENKLLSSGDKILVETGKKALAKSYTYIGLFYYYKGNNDTAIVKLKKALDLANNCNDKIQLGIIYSNTGVIYNAKGDYAKALDYYSQALNVSIETAQKRIESAALTNMGLIYQRQSDYPKALEYCLKALKLQDEMGKTSPSTLCIIGNIYNDQSDYKNSLLYYQKAHDLAIKIEDKRVEEVCDYLIGTVYFSRKDYQTCIDYQFKSLTISKEIGEKEDIATSLGNLGSCYKSQGDSAEAARNIKFSESVKYPLAGEYYRQALKINEEMGDKSEVAYNLGEIGELDIKQKNYPEAEKFLQQSLVLSDSVGDIENQRARHLNLSELDSITGNYKDALKQFEFYKMLNDSMFSINKNKEITRHEMSYAFAKREDSLKAEQEKKETNLKAEEDKKAQKQRLIRNVLTGGLFFAVLFALVFFFQRKRISKEKKRSDELLLNILPEEVAEELKEKGSTEAKTFDEVTVMFTDFKGFTTLAEELSAKELVAEIDYCFKGFDNIIHKYNIEKIKTIGDSYMAAGGLPVANKTHAKDVVNAALEIVKFMEEHKQQRIKEGKPVFEIRIGINTGHVVAGIVGVKKFAYDIWGDTVNLASRMESSGESGKINISGSTYELVKDNFICTHRGKIQAKNKGEVDMYFVDGKV